MKYLIPLLLILSGCSSAQVAAFGRGFSDTPARQREFTPLAMPTQPQQNVSAKQTDFGCVGRCTESGNQYGLCVSKCSY